MESRLFADLFFIFWPLLFVLRCAGVFAGVTENESTRQDAAFHARVAAAVFHPLT